MNALRTPELKEAFDDVERSRVRLSEAFLDVERGIVRGYERADRVAYLLRAPERFVRKYPWASVIFCLAAGYLISTRARV